MNNKKKKVKINKFNLMFPMTKIYKPVCYYHVYTNMPIRTKQKIAVSPHSPRRAQANVPSLPPRSRYSAHLNP